MSFESQHELTPDFQVYISRDSESQERPTIKATLAGVSFSCTVDIINPPDDIEVVTESAGHDRAPDEIERLKLHAERSIRTYIDKLRAAYGEQHFS